MQLTRFLKDQQGAAALEFALVLPIMLVLYFGMSMATQALLVDRRVSYLASAVSDLTSQQAVLKQADIDDIYKVANQVMKPFPTGTLAIRVTSVQNDANGKHTVLWTSDNKTKFPSTDPVNLKDMDTAANIAIIRAETRYEFDSPFKNYFPDTLTFRHKIDMRPRGGAAVSLVP